MKDDRTQPLSQPGDTLSPGRLLTEVGGTIVGGTDLGTQIQPGQTIQTNAVLDFLLFGTVLAPHGLVQGMRTLFPGETSTANEKKPYLKLDLELSRLDADEYVDLLDAMLEKILAGFRGPKKALLLSGGIDSAIILSYLTPQQDMPCITWSATTPTETKQSMDKRFSFVTAAAYGVTQHEIVHMDYERDVEAYRTFISRSRIPHIFSNVAPYIRMAERAQEMGIEQCALGQNVDTLFLAYAAPHYVSLFQRLHRFLPLKLISPFVRKRFQYLLAEKSLVREFAYFKSAGVFPGPWINVPETYLKEHEAAVDRFLPKGKTIEQRIQLVEEFLSEGRRSENYQREIPRFWGVESVLPYYHDDFIQALLRMPPKLLRLGGGYDKQIFQKLAAKRGVPEPVIQHVKKGLSYSAKYVLTHQLHLSVWDELEKDDLLNHFVDIKSIRQKLQDDFYTFDLLRSLHIWFEEVAKPLNLRLEP